MIQSNAIFNELQTFNLATEFFGRRVQLRSTFQAKLYLSRLVLDHDNTPAPLRKSTGLKDAIKLHQVCGAFLWFQTKMQAMCPESQFADIQKEVSSQFVAGLLDADLLHIVETQVPANSDIKAVAGFRLGRCMF